jgi:serine/threonine protein kinase
MVTSKNYYGDKADIWSIGSVLLEVLLGHDEFHTRWLHVYENNIIKNKELFKITISNNIKTLPKIRKLPKDSIDLIVNILKENPSERITIENMLLHPWLHIQTEKTILSTSFPSINSNNRLINLSKSTMKRNQSELSLLPEIL